MAEKPEPGVCDVDIVPEGAYEIVPSELKSRLKRIIQYGKDTGIIIPVFLYGPPGVGKSAIASEIAVELGMDLHTFIASTMDPTEIRGIPVPMTEEKEKYSEWYPQRQWVEGMGNTNIYFFDELNLATQATQAAFYRLILEGKLDTIDISRAARIAAGNRKEDVSTIKAMPMPLTTRFEIYYIKAEAKSWLDWARKNDIDENVIGYIEEHPGQIFCTNKTKPDVAKATPRSWTRVSQLLKVGLNTKEDIAGSIGFDPANKFLAYMAKKPERKIPNLGTEEIL